VANRPRHPDDAEEIDAADASASELDPLTPGDVDVAVVGAGIIGLATARELLRRHPRLHVAVVERESSLAAHQTGHNSGVLHRGLYYTPGSLKARLCVEGARAMEDYCEAKGVPLEHCGKLIVATAEHELERLAELERRGRANGVPGLRRLTPTEMRTHEPHAAGIAALLSPRTGIVDYGVVSAALADDVEATGGRILTGCGVHEIAVSSRRISLRAQRGEVRARHAIFCAGAWSDRLAVAAGGDPDPRIVPFRGAYMKLRPERRGLVRSLIYPVPDPSLPFLGVHLTRHISGEVLVGPSALLAPARDAYRLATVRPSDLLSTLAWPGTWRMARRWWRTGLTEMGVAASRRSFVAAAARFVPVLTADDVIPGPSGVRAQAVGRDGGLVDDFVFSHTDRALHVRNAPSPAATSSLSIAAHIADQAEARFDLGRGLHGSLEKPA
jgi:(S)-2-hydroxyglutarate dehydrogenase